jgi:hypothetical protein
MGASVQERKAVAWFMRSSLHLRRRSCAGPLWPDSHDSHDSHHGQLVSTVHALQQSGWGSSRPAESGETEGRGNEDGNGKGKNLSLPLLSRENIMHFQVDR